MAGNVIGSAVITIEADPSDFKRTIGRDLDKAGRDAGEKAGKQTGWTFSRAVGANLLSAGLGSVIGNAFSAATTAVKNLISSTIGAGLSTAAAMETAQIGFETMLGSAQKADSFLRKLGDFAARTPFEFPELQTAAGSLISIGIDANKVIPIMTTLGDVTSGMGTGAEGVRRATVAIQQMNAAGRITAEDLNQLRDAGIPVFDLLAGATGRSKEELAAMAQNGKLGRLELEQLMAALETGKGLERFNGLMEKQSQSLSGIVSTFRDTVNMGFASALTPLVPLIKSSLGWLSESVLPAVLAGVTKLGSGLVAFIGRMAPIFAGVIVPELQRMGDALAPLGTAFQNLVTFVTPLAVLLGRLALGAFIVAWTALREVLEVVLPPLAAITGFLARNSELFTTVAVAILAGVAAWRAYRGVLVLVTAAKTAYVAITAGLPAILMAARWAVVLFNMALAANPIGVVITLIAALAAALIYAWNNSETFRAVVTGAWEGIKAAVGAVVDWFMNVVWPGMVSIWDGIAGSMQAFWGWVSGVFAAGWQMIQDWILAPIAAAYGGIVATFQSIWAFIEPWVNWAVAFFQSVWAVLEALIVLPIRLAQIGIVAVLNGVVDAFTWVWGWVSGVFMGWWRTIEPLVMFVMRLVWTNIQAVWNGVVAVFTWAWAWVSGTFMGWWGTLTGLVDFVMRLVWSNIIVVWNLVRDAFTAAWGWVSGVFMGWWNQLTSLMETPIRLAKTAIDGFLDGMKSAFRIAVDVIRATWDGVKAAVRSPVDVAIRVGNWLIGGFRSVARLVGLDDLANRLVDIPPLPPMATGGRATDRVPGSRARGRDSTLALTSRGVPIALVDPGEGIVRNPAMRSLDQDYPGFFENLNRDGSRYLDALGLHSFFLGGTMPTTAGAINPHGLPYYGARWAGDMPRPLGTPVYAWHPGTVAGVRSLTSSYGNNITINHAPNLGSSLYAHLQRFLVSAGQQVRAGQQIATVDSTGNSTGHHLHFEARGGSAPLIGAAASGSVQGQVDYGLNLLDRFAGPLRELAEKIGESPFGQIVKRIPRMLSDGMLQKIKDAAAVLLSAGDAGSVPFVPGGGGTVPGLSGVTSNTYAKAANIYQAARGAGHRVSTVGGYRGDGEHVTRRALDFMVNNRSAGDYISNYVWGNRGRFGLQHVIWWQRIISAARAGEGWRPMADRGSPTQNHMDHPHVLFDSRDLGLDSGGWLPPGRSLTNNTSGRPEPVLSAGQWDDVSGLLGLLRRQQEAEASSKRGEVHVTVNYSPTIDPHAVNPRREYENFTHDFVRDVEALLR